MTITAREPASTRALVGNNPIRIALLVLCLCGIVHADYTFAAADRKEGREREAFKKMQIMQKKLLEEKAALEQQKTQLEEEKAGLSGKIKNLESELGHHKHAEAQANSAKAALTKELEASNDKLTDSQKQLQDLTQKHDEALRQLGVRDKQVKQLESANAQQMSLTESCESKNVKLYRLNVEILEKYRNKGIWEALRQEEPFTQIEDVEINNIVQEYKDKLDAQKIELHSQNR